MALTPKMEVTIKVPPTSWLAVLDDPDGYAMLSNVGVVYAATKEQAMKRARGLFDAHDVPDEELYVERLATCKPGWRYFT